MEKEDTMITVQLDFALSEQYDMYFIDRDGEKKRPYIIHRTSLGCYERTLAWLIESMKEVSQHGCAQSQVRVLPISEKYEDYANQVCDELRKNGILAHADHRSEKINYKIRDSRLNRVPYMLVVGQKEEEDRQVSVRSRFAGDEGVCSLDNFLDQISKEIRTKQIRKVEEVNTSEGER